MNFVKTSFIANNPSSNEQRIHIVRNPYSSEAIGSVELSDQNDIALAFDNARGVFKNRKCWLSRDQRLAVLKNLVKLMKNDTDKLVHIAASEGGKPIVDTKTEVQRAIRGVELCIRYLSQNNIEPVYLHSDDSESHIRTSYSIKEPIGTVVAVSAFNHPLNLIVHQVIPAIACGNPILIKPAADTPLSCFNLVKLIYKSGLPIEWCQVLMTGSHAQTQTLITNEQVSLFTFVGSAKIGWMLRNKLSPGTRCLLEHGGVAPVIVEETADLTETVASIVKGGFYHAGQVCVSVQRVFLPDTRLKEFCDELVKQTQLLVTGDQLSDKTDVGPLIRSSEISRVESWINEAIREGATLLCGGKRTNESCLSPTLLLNPNKSSKVTQQEIFGPVIALYSYSNIGDAIEQANHTLFSFQSSVFSKDIDKSNYIARELNSSAVMINDHSAFRDDDMPFSGLNQSGLGVGGIRNTINEMQTNKMIVQRVKGDNNMEKHLKINK
ncbi:aldehyde dehydrogenase family protein [Vibrio artabrorum]|uniref:aldehyde dehydrogenase family protein n=1 Tax=Vibrio artabrorum TaxID=446374 RepID=UPI003553B0DF